MGYFEKGKDYYEQGKYSQALEYFLAAMEEDKLNAEVCFWSALTYKSMNNDFGYRKSVFRALSIDPDNDAALSEAKLIFGGAVGKQISPNKGKGLQTGFSVSSSKRVLFASGNVQYHDYGDHWTFAEKQYIALGDHGSLSYMGKIYYSINFHDFDLFYWGTSDDIKAGIEKVKFFAEWGDHFAGGWRTLSYEEWDYLFTKRKNAENLYGFSSVMGVEGVVILPDECACSEIKESYDDNSSWAKMEGFGAAFLPIAGYYSRESDKYYDGDWVYQTCSHNQFYYRLDKRKQKNMTQKTQLGGMFGTFFQQIIDDIPHMDLDKSFQLPVRLVKDIID